MTRDLVFVQLLFFQQRSRVVSMGCVSGRNFSSFLWKVTPTRVGIGRTKLTHGLLMEGRYPPFCDDCLIPLSVKYILIECPTFNDERLVYFG